MSTEEERHQNSSFFSLGFTSTATSFSSSIPWIEHSPSSSAAWNDREAELNKAFCTPASAEYYLNRQTNLAEQFWTGIELARLHGFRPNGHGVDIGAGVCWTTAWLSQFPEVHSLGAIDISEHRLKEFAPPILRSFGAEMGKIDLILGDFMNLSYRQRPADFIFMAQMLHHADDPDRLLLHVEHLLGKNGFVLIIGEEPVSFRSVLKRRFLHPLTPFTKLFPPDEWGDHYYRFKDYQSLFRGWEWDYRCVGSSVVFVLFRPSS